MKELPKGICRKGGSTYRRFKVKAEGRWVDHYVKLPSPDDPGFRKALALANKAARDGVYGEEIKTRVK
jgi:hypothetical protein